MLLRLFSSCASSSCSSCIEHNPRLSPNSFLLYASIASILFPKVVASDFHLSMPSPSVFSFAGVPFVWFS
uniref:MADS5 n=1 Tax=Arundo donax TaxID=35708 RepID=A0A0A9ELD0_ARUDO